MEIGMTISELVIRLEEIENETDGNPKELCSELIDDLIEIEISMDKELRKFAKENKFQSDDIMMKLILEGIKSGSVGDA